MKDSLSSGYHKHLIAVCAKSGTTSYKVWITFPPLNKINAEKTTFCIYSGYFCVINYFLMKSVSETNKQKKEKKTQKGANTF